MRTKHLDPLFKERRKELRNNPTPQEYKLWFYLRNKNLGVKFQRQYSIGPYIADFYCAKKKLIIEADGSQHLDNKEYDDLRTDFFNTLGYTVIRFWNNEIDTNIEGVLMRIKAVINQSTP